MAIGKHSPKAATNTDLKEAVRIGLDECTTALEECFHGLSDQQVWRTWPAAGRQNIGSIVMHCIENLNSYGLWVQGAEGLLGEEDWFNVEVHDADRLRPMQKGMKLPPVSEMMELLAGTRNALFETLEATGEEQLLTARPGVKWFETFQRTAADAYMRTTMHTMAHVRQVWCLRGAMGLAAEANWPQQHWA